MFILSITIPGAFSVFVAHHTTHNTQHNQLVSKLYKSVPAIRYFCTVISTTQFWMSEYCEYMWDPTRGHASSQLARSIYEQNGKLDIRDKSLAIKTVRAILRGMPDVDLKHCTDEYITRFLLARKYRAEQTASLIAAYQAQVANRQDIFGNLTARDPAIQRALRAGIPGVLPARDRKGRCILVILASQWDPIAVPALALQRAIFLVLEILIQDPRNQQNGFVAVVDWGEFSLRQAGALGAAAIRNLIAALRGRFPARFKAIHFLSPPLYVQATLALVKPFLDEKTRHKIYLHGNNLSTLHQHLPTDILPAELGGTGPPFNAGMWAEPVINSAMKEAELAALKQKKNIEEHNVNTIKEEEEKDMTKTQNDQVNSVRIDRNKETVSDSEKRLKITEEQNQLNNSTITNDFGRNESLEKDFEDKLQMETIKKVEFELGAKVSQTLNSKDNLERSTESNVKSETNFGSPVQTNSFDEYQCFEKNFEDQVEDISERFATDNPENSLEEFTNENHGDDRVTEKEFFKVNGSKGKSFLEEDHSEVRGFLEHSSNDLEHTPNSLGSEKHTEESNLIT